MCDKILFNINSIDNSSEDYYFIKGKAIPFSSKEEVMEFIEEIDKINKTKRCQGYKSHCKNCEVCENIAFYLTD